MAVKTLQVLQLTRQQLPRTVEPRADGPGGTAHAFRYLFIPQPLYVPQNNDEAQLRFETQQRLVKLLLYLLLKDMRLRARRLRARGKTPGDARLAHVKSLLVATIVQAAVDRQAVKPGRESRLPVELPEPLVSPDEHFLRQVFGGLVLAGHAVSEAVRARAIALVEAGKQLPPAG